MGDFGNCISIPLNSTNKEVIILCVNKDDVGTSHCRYKLKLLLKVFLKSIIHQ